MRTKIILILSPFLLIAVLPAYAVTVKHALTDISQVYDAEIYIEEGIENEEALDLPENPPPDMDPRVMLDRHVKGYSYAVHYEGDDIVRIMVFKSGAHEYVKIPTIKKARDSLPEPEGQTIISHSANVTRIKPDTSKSNYQALPTKNWMQSYHDKDYNLNAAGSQFRENAFGVRLPNSKTSLSKQMYAMGPSDSFFSSTNQNTPSNIKEMSERKSMANSAMFYQLQQQALVSRQQAIISRQKR
jgi:hypothetical protein